jgi:hypothetical protein
VIDVCSTPSTDPLYTAAANFCQGFVVGAYQSYEAAIAKGKRKPFICLPAPVNRNEASRSSSPGEGAPRVQGRAPINFLLKFLREKWPCPSESLVPVRSDAVPFAGSRGGR